MASVGVSVGLTYEMYRFLQACADEDDVNVQSVIRDAVEQYMKVRGDPGAPVAEDLPGNLYDPYSSAGSTLNAALELVLGGTVSLDPTQK